MVAIPGLQAQNIIAFTGAKIIPVAGPEIASGVLVIQNDKIVAVGPAGTTTIPGDAKRIDATGKVIMPGLVESHSHIGARRRAATAAHRFSRTCGCSIPSMCAMRILTRRGRGRDNGERDAGVGSSDERTDALFEVASRQNH
jgi:hypothetical protein